MRKILIVVVLLVISIYSFSNVKLDDFVIHDFNNAIKIGDITGKNVIVMFSSETCYYCKKFKNEVLVDKEIQKWLRTEFVIAEINPDRNKKAVYKGKTLNYAELFGAFGVRGTPTFFFFNSKGEALAQLPGYVEKDTFLSILKYFKYYRNEKISFKNFLSKKVDVVIGKKILKLNKEDIDFLLKNDPNTKKYNKKLDEFTNVVMDEEDKKVEDKYYVVIYKK